MKTKFPEFLPVVEVSGLLDIYFLENIKYVTLIFIKKYSAIGKSDDDLALFSFRKSSIFTGANNFFKLLIFNNC